MVAPFRKQIPMHVLAGAANGSERQVTEIVESDGISDYGRVTTSFGPEGNMNFTPLS